MPEQKPVTPVRHIPTVSHDAPTGKAATGTLDEGVEPYATYPVANDIYPRPPLDPAAAGYLDLSTGAYDYLPGLPGMIVDTGIKDQISRIPETQIPFGFAVAAGATNAGFCKLATAAGDHIIGIAVLDFTCLVTNVSAGVPYFGYAANTWSCRVLRVGRIWALPTTAVAVGDPVGFGADGSLSNAGTAIKGATWATATPAANQLAEVQINLS